MGWLIAALIIGAAASAGSGILARKNQREEATAQAEFEKQKLEHQTQTTLGSMDREYAIQKESDLEKASAIERGGLNDLTQSMQQSYIERLASESNHMDLMAQTEQELGVLAAQEGTSGVRSDATLGAILSSERSRKVKESRNSIDRASATSIGLGQMGFSEAQRQARTIRNQYKEGGALAELYSFKRSQVETGASLEEDWLDTIIDENEYKGDWIWADVFGVAGSAAGAITGAYSGGLLGGKKG